MRRPARVHRRSEGFTVIETLISLTLLTIGLVSLAGVVVSSSRQTELESDRQMALESAQNLLEQVKASDPQLIVATFDDQQFAIPGVNGDVAVDIDDTNPALLGVVVTASWDTGGSAMTLVLQTEIYNSNG